VPTTKASLMVSSGVPEMASALTGADNCAIVAPSKGYSHRDGAGIPVQGNASMINANYAVRSISPGSITTKRE
jgi:hypothetical protein